MSKCTTTAMIELVKEIRVGSLEEAESVRFSIDLNRQTAMGILAHSDNLGLKDIRDLAVVLDYLISYMAEGQIILKNKPTRE